MNQQFFLITLLFCVSSLCSANPAAAIKEPLSLCNREEKVVFNCAVKSAQISVCAKTQKGSSVQYRYGTSKKIEMSVPTQGVKGVKYGNLMFSGGGGAFVRFPNKDIEYIVFSQIGKDGEKAGVVVTKNGKKLKQLDCTDGGGDVAVDILEAMKITKDEGDGPDI